MHFKFPDVRHRTKHRKIEVNPGSLAASTYYGIGNVMVRDHFCFYLLLIFSAYFFARVFWVTDSYYFHCRFDICEHTRISK